MRLRAGILAALLAHPALAEAPALYIAGTVPESGDYGEVLAALSDVGAEGTTLTLYWDLMAARQAGSAEPDWPAIANAVYPAMDLSLTLVFPVIDTVHDRRPEALRGLHFDDPAVVSAFVDFAAEMLSRMTDVEVTSIGVGNEVDGLLGPETYAEYQRFFEDVKVRMAGIAPGIPIGVTQTWGDLQASTAAQDLARVGDVVMVNWYPLSADFTVAPPGDATDEMVRMAALFPGRRLHLTEVGAPSGGCNASEETQRAFVRNVSAAAGAGPFDAITWVWMHDLSPGAAEDYATYYGLAGNDCFSRYLATLGLRTWDGEDKPAFAALREAAE